MIASEIVTNTEDHPVTDFQGSLQQSNTQCLDIGERDQTEKVWCIDLNCSLALCIVHTYDH
jgi:hypothetical protein